MPILGSIATAIGGAITGVVGFLGSGSILAKLAISGLAMAASYAANKFLTPKAQEATITQVPTASKLETRYGENLVREIVLGVCGTAGHHIYRNHYDAGNRVVQDVFALSHFRAGGVNRVLYEGAWLSLGGAEDPLVGYRVQGIPQIIWIKFYAGTMDQTADANLIAEANPAGRWTSNHRGAGVAYAIVTQVMERGVLESPWTPFFELIGAPCYDWRKDTSVGGSGAHRWNNQATWEFTRNPVVQMYNLERGFYNGTELIVGKGSDAADLPLDAWTLAANICDENMGDNERYESNLIVTSGAGVTHDNNMQPLLEACAGSWVELADGRYPIVGANQASVMTMTDDDLIVDQPFSYSKYRPEGELVNTVAGTYISAENFYQPTPMTTRIDAGALSQDGKRLAVSLPFRAVTWPTNADRLADIAIRASRYQSQASVCVKSRFIGVKPGQWITWISATHNFEKKFQITAKQLGPLNKTAARCVFMQLQEVGDGIFDPTAYVTNPPTITGQGAPTYQTELTGVLVTPYTVSSGGQSYPAIRVQFDPPTDPTVTSIEVRYWPEDQPAAVKSILVSAAAAQVIISDGIMSNQVFKVDYALHASPYRVPIYSPDYTVTAPNVSTDVDVSLANMQDDMRLLLLKIAQRQDQEILPLIERLALNATLSSGRNRSEFATVVRNARALATSFLVLESTVEEQGDQITAQALAILGVQVNVDNLAAGGRIRFEAQIPPPAGVLASIEVMARASDDDDFIESGMIIQVYVEGAEFKSRILMITDQFIVTDGSLTGFPFVFEGSVLKLNTMWAKTLISPRLQSPDGLSFIDLGAGIIDMRFS